MTQYEATLKSYMSKYKDANLARQDIVKTIVQYKDLKPSLDNYVFNDGSRRELVRLDGTIPVTYRGSTYNIPISVWILDTHPFNPPMVYVKPTATMQIKPGKYVDTNGKVDMPYIKDWRYPKSDLLSLVQILTFIFGDECPVFSRSSDQRLPQGMPGMPAPASYHQQPPYNYPNQSYPPQYPQTGGYPNQPPNPSYPSYPPSTHAGGFPVPYPTAGSVPPYPRPNQPAHAPQYPPASAGYQPPQFNNQVPQQTPYPMNNAGEFRNASSRPPLDLTPGGTVTEADLRASLLSAVEDKMKRRLRETFAQAQAEMDVLTKTQKDLNNGQAKLDGIIVDLEKEQNELVKNIQLLTDKDKEVKEAIDKMESNDEVDIDEAVVTTTPLYKQLVGAFAEEQSIEDAVYYLGEGLRKNVIELEVFLKRVRELSRRRFILRATIHKCRERAGLPPLD